MNCDICGTSEVATIMVRGRLHPNGFQDWDEVPLPGMERCRPCIRNERIREVLQRIVEALDDLDVTLQCCGRPKWSGE